VFYTFSGVDYGKYDNWIGPFYYSVVTITTLGYGDIVPATPVARIIAIFEVFIGYIMLGGLLSIFTNKMARRGD
jgi:voltage-gated potassium channel Kch